MPQLKIWGVMSRMFIALTLVTLFAVGPAFGQAQQGMQFEVPYEFSFGSKVLPAGTYTFYLESNGLAVRSRTSGPFRQIIISRLEGPSEFFQDGALVFEKAEGKRLLTEVWIPGTKGLLVHRNPRGLGREILLSSALNQARPVSGKVAYNLTCSRCHGPDGMGNEKADKFFNISIPRLSSAVVQGKSDAELRELINQGVREMPPVEIDEAGFRHRLPPQDVDAVIQYMRTLKRE